MNTTRRQFLIDSASCAAHLALVASLTPVAAHALHTRPRSQAVVASEPFGSLEKIADGVWALISTPFGGDRTTLSNGGIVAGRNATLAIEGFFQPRGARWLSEQALALTGRWPTHVVLTHYHADHANGLTGYSSDKPPSIYASDRTRALVLERNLPANAALADALKDIVRLSTLDATTIDLGNRVVQIVPRWGHTESDVSIELPDEGVVFAGDLVWNGMFPNFVDATPSRLSAAVRALPRSREAIYVPGHGAVARSADLERYIVMLDEVERAARTSHSAGRPAAGSAAEFTLPPSLGEWTLMNRVFFERAFTAWYRELGG